MFLFFLIIFLFCLYGVGRWVSIHLVYPFLQVVLLVIGLVLFVFFFRYSFWYIIDLIILVFYFFGLYFLYDEFLLPFYSKLSKTFKFFQVAFRSEIDRFEISIRDTFSEVWVPNPNFKRSFNLDIKNAQYLTLVEYWKVVNFVVKAEFQDMLDEFNYAMPGVVPTFQKFVWNLYNFVLYLKSLYLNSLLPILKGVIPFLKYFVDRAFVFVSDLMHRIDAYLSRSEYEYNGDGDVDSYLDSVYKHHNFWDLDED